MITFFFKHRCVRWFWWLLGPLAWPCKNWNKNGCQTLHQIGATWENKTLLQLGFQVQIQMLMSQLLNISETKFSTVFGLYIIDLTIKWHPHYLRFTPNPDCNHDWRRTFSLGTTSRCSPPSPWPVPRLRDPGIGASAKPGRQTTPAKHNMTSTVETCTMWKGRFSPQTKQQKQAGSPQKDKQGLFCSGFSLLWLQKCSRFTSWLQTVNWRIDGKTGFLEACS